MNRWTQDNLKLPHLATNLSLQQSSIMTSLIIQKSSSLAKSIMHTPSCTWSLPVLQSFNVFSTWHHFMYFPHGMVSWIYDFFSLSVIALCLCCVKCEYLYWITPVIVEYGGEHVRVPVEVYLVLVKRVRLGQLQDCLVASCPRKFAESGQRFLLEQTPHDLVPRADM